MRYQELWWWQNAGQERFGGECQVSQSSEDSAFDEEGVGGTSIEEGEDEKVGGDGDEGDYAEGGTGTCLTNSSRRST